MFMIGNMLGRRNTSRAVSVRVRNNPQTIKTFMNLVAEPTFTEQLGEAIRQPESANAKRITGIVQRTTSMAGGQVPWSSEERQSAPPRLLALFAYHGAPSVFVTIAPSANDSTYTLRLARGRATTDEDVHIPLPKMSERHRIVTENPFAAALSYERLINAVLECLIRLRPSHRSKKSNPIINDRKVGLFGVPLAYVGVTEAQSKGAAHFHFVLWCDSSPACIQRHITDPARMAALAARIDSMVTAALTENAQHAAENLSLIHI